MTFCSDPGTTGDPLTPCLSTSDPKFDALPSPLGLFDQSGPPYPTSSLPML